jgi:hypothetical protein
LFIVEKVFMRICLVCFQSVVSLCEKTIVCAIAMILSISVSLGSVAVWSQDSSATKSAVPAQSSPSSVLPLLKNSGILINDSTLKIPIESQSGAKTDVKSEKAIARIATRLVYKKDIEPPGKMKSEAKKQLGDKYGKWLEDTRTQQLFFGIWEPIRQTSMQAGNITASDAEVKSYIDNAKKIALKQLPQAEEQLAKINQALKAGSVPKEKLSEAQQYKAFLEQRITAVRSTKEPTAQEKEMARSLIMGWKFDKMLYKQYGGRVIAGQQSPFSPVGAYKSLLQDKQKEGLFEIYDKAILNKFWSVFDKAPKEATVPKEKVNYDKPWWEIAGQ